MKISETEMEIMKIIWDKNGKVTTSELADKMPDKKLTTISTLAGKEFVKSIYRGSAKSLISALFRDEAFTKADIDEFKRFIEEQE